MKGSINKNLLNLQKSTIMIYDIEFIVPVCLNGKYLKRLETFLKYGLQNIQNKKVLLTLICAEHEREQLNNININFCDINIQTNKENHCVPKVYEYLSNYSNDNVRWIAKIDDDSLNDVSELVDKLDRNYDHERDYYIIPPNPKKDVHSIEIELLKSHKLISPEFIVSHEIEISISSQSTMKKLKKVSNFFRDRAKISNGYSDQSMAIGARMVKIYPVECHFISHLPLIGDFSILGGKLNHVHLISNDTNVQCFNFMVDRLENRFEKKADAILFEAFTNKEFFFSWEENKNKGVILKLGEMGKIFNSVHINESLWTVKNGNLEFLNIEARPTTIFNKATLLETMNGNFLKNPRATMTLRPLALDI